MLNFISLSAALNLGCTPRKASRSQRNNNSTNYLSSRNQELSPPPMTMKTSQGLVTNFRCVPYFWSLVKPVTNDLGHSGFRYQSLLPNHNSATEKFPALLSPHGLMENALPSDSFSVYPLHYGNDVRWQGQHSGIEVAPKPISTYVDSTNGGVVEKNSVSDTMAANGIAQSEVRHSLANPCDNKCDLALRLGPRSSNENKTLLPVLKVGLGSSPEETESDDWKLPLFPTVNAYGLSEHDSWGQSLEGECGDDAERSIRKRKANFSHLLKERHSSWLPKLPSSRFIG